MASDAAQPMEDMGTAHLAGRHVLDMTTIRQLSGRSDLQGFLRFAGHFGYLGLTSTLIWYVQTNYWLLIPAMIMHGFGLVTMFAAMHECVHRTAFDSRKLNDIFGWIAGALCCYNFTYYRKYHTLHHRHTQDPELDPELETPKPKSLGGYIYHLSGIGFWFLKPKELLIAIVGRSRYVPQQAKKAVAISAACQLGLYLALLVGSFVLQTNVVLLLWFLPLVLAQPLLRAILIVEHTGCSHDENGLTNTRTTLTTWPIRFLMWNMPFHAEHHLYPSIPFFRLPDAHVTVKERLEHLSPGYPAANREVLQSFGSEQSVA